MKKSFLFLITLLFCYLCLFFPLYGKENGTSDLIGDVNSDGTIDITDALAIAQFYIGINHGIFNTHTADVDYNGVIDIVDALMTAGKYVGLLSTFPADQVYAQLTAWLNEEINKWNSYHITSYTYDCLIPVAETNTQRLVLVTVYNNAVTAAKEKNTGVPIPAANLSNYFTIDQLIAIFKEALDGKLLENNTSTNPGQNTTLLLSVYTSVPIIPDLLPGQPALFIYIPYQFKSFWYSMF